MKPGECKTIQVLKHCIENNTDDKALASACLRIIEDIRESGFTDLSLAYLHEFLEDVYKRSGSHLHDHLLEGADCDICRAIASRL